MTKITPTEYNVLMGDTNHYGEFIPTVGFDNNEKCFTGEVYKILLSTEELQFCINGKLEDVIQFIRSRTLSIALDGNTETTYGENIE